MAWHPLNTPLPVVVRYGYTKIYNTERLTSIFNFGFGDLAISDERIGSNAVDQYEAVELHTSAVPAGQGDRTVLLGYSTAGRAGTVYPGSVQVVDGGALAQTEGVPNDGWVERTASQAARFIQLDIAGRLMRQGGGGIENLSCVFEAEYQAPGSSTWVPFPFSPMTITNGATRPVRETFAALLDGPALKFRVRRTTPDPTDANEVSELELTRIKVFRDNDALYPAQLRRAMMIKATGQLNGRVEQYSAMVQAKHWIWASAEPWDGTYPGAGGHWVWGHTVNPAWLFIYFARGGFLNATATPAHLGQAGWLDEPSPGNGERLFGAGLPNRRIDYGTLIAWGQACDAAGLECRMVLRQQRSAGMVLDDIAAAGRASKTWAPGKLSVWWEAAGQPHVAAFGASNIVAGTFKVAYVTADDVDELGVSYTRSDDDYKADTVYATVPGVTLPVNQSVGNSVFSMPRALAQRLVNLLAASRHYHRRTITWESTLFGLTVATGDVVHLAHDLTAWAASGRLVRLRANAGRIVEVVLSRPVDAIPGADCWLWISQPGGQYVSVRCVAPAAATRELQVVDLWPLADAPGWLDGRTRNPDAQELFEDTGPEDWTFLAGPTPTPGKRARIIKIEPISARRVRITARDEVPEYYPLEWSLASVPDVPAGDRLVARAYNVTMARRAAGGWLLSWELEGATGAQVLVSLNAGPAAQVPIKGYLTVAGRELLLPDYPAGAALDIQVRPVAQGVPVAVEAGFLRVVV